MVNRRWALRLALTAPVAALRGSMRRLADRSAPSIERFGFGGAAFGAIKIGYVTQALRHGGVVRPERLFQNRHTAAIERCRRGIGRAPLINSPWIAVNAGCGIR